MHTHKQMKVKTHSHGASENVVMKGQCMFTEEGFNLGIINDFLPKKILYCRVPPGRRKRKGEQQARRKKKERVTLEERKETGLD